MKKLTNRLRYNIAKKHMITLEEREDLGVPNNDREYFFEISVWELVDIAAYELGQKNILKNLDKK